MYHEERVHGKEELTPSPVSFPTGLAHSAGQPLTRTAGGAETGSGPAPGQGTSPWHEVFSEPSLFRDRALSSTTRQSTHSLAQSGQGGPQTPRHQTHSPSPFP